MGTGSLLGNGGPPRGSGDGRFRVGQTIRIAGRSMEFRRGIPLRRDRRTGETGTRARSVGERLWRVRMDPLLWLFEPAFSHFAWPLTPFRTDVRHTSARRFLHAP